MSDIIPFAHDASSVAEPASVPHTLTFDCQCRKCGYNLRGLEREGRCPECNTPVGLSAQGDLLRFADPTWLRKLTSGLSCVLWGLLITIVMSMTVGCLSGVLHPQIGSGIILAGSAIYAFGAYRFTEPDPSGLSEAKYSLMRRGIRWSIGLGLFGAALAVLLDPGAPSMPIAAAIGGFH